MHAPAPCADTSASAGGLVPFLPAVDARAASGGRSTRLESILRRRDEYITETGDSIERDLARIADELGARIVEALESRGLGDIRVAVDTTTLEDVLDILYELGVNDSQAAWFERLRTLAGYAEDAAVAAEMRREDISLDQEGLAAALDARYQDAASWWDATIERPLAQGILDGLQDARALTTLDDLSARLSQRARISLPAAVTEAKTQTAVVDRFISAESSAPRITREPPDFSSPRRIGPTCVRTSWLETSPAVTPSEAMRSGSRSTRTSREAPPMRLTLPTPGTELMSRITFRSTNHDSSVSLMFSALTPKAMMAAPAVVARPM